MYGQHQLFVLACAAPVDGKFKRASADSTVRVRLRDVHAECGRAIAVIESAKHDDADELPAGPDAPIPIAPRAGEHRRNMVWVILEADEELSVLGTVALQQPLQIRSFFRRKLSDVPLAQASTIQGDNRRRSRRAPAIQA